MFKNLIPWKKHHGDLTVRHEEPTRESNQDNFPLTYSGNDLETLFQRLFEKNWLGANWPYGRFGPTGGFLSNGNHEFGWEDREKEYVLQSELPGFEPEDFDVKVSGNVLTVRAEHQDEERNENASNYRYNSFLRTFTLPHGANEEEIDARYHSGILEIHVPKRSEAQGKRIEVKSS